MNFKYTANTLKKLEELYDEAKYIIRYERGHFNSGYCILEEKKVVVINKFFNTEGRINALIEILPSIIVNIEALSPDILKSYRQFMEKPAFEQTETIQAKLNI